MESGVKAAKKRRLPTFLVSGGIRQKVTVILVLVVLALGALWLEISRHVDTSNLSSLSLQQILALYSPSLKLHASTGPLSLGGGADEMDDDDGMRCGRLKPPPPPSPPPPERLDCPQVDMRLQRFHKGSDPADVRLPLVNREGPLPRVFDVFLFNTELDTLDFRMQELWHEVDVFVICESNITFSEQPKPMAFTEVMHTRFQHYLSKVVTIDCSAAYAEDMAPVWARETGQRRCCEGEGPAKAGAKDGDVIVMGDADEIPMPKSLRAARDCTGWEGRSGAHASAMCLLARFYYYSFEFRVLRPLSWWQSPVVAIWPDVHNIRTLAHEKMQCAFDAAWHCSWCFAKLSEFVNKMNSYSHQEFNKPEIVTPELIKQRAEAGIDVNNRDYVTFRNSTPEELDPTQLPRTVTRLRHCFPHMLDRTQWALET